MHHVMQTVSDSADGWTIECFECGAVRAVFKDGRPFQTLVAGDIVALHAWSSTPDLVLAGAVEPQMHRDTPGNLFARSMLIDRAEWKHAWRPPRCEATCEGVRCEMDAGHERTVSIYGSSLDDHNARNTNGKWLCWSTKPAMVDET
jgi:hypothetical protein